MSRPVVAIAVLLVASLAACTGRVSRAPAVAAPSPSPPAPAPPQDIVLNSASPERIRTHMARWFAHAGYKEFQVSALLAHARRESGFHPCIAGAAGLRYLYQWGGTRRSRLASFAGTDGCPPLDRQLAFADRELRGNAKFSCFWQAETASGALAALRRGFGRGSC